MERTTVIFGGTVLVSGTGQLGLPMLPLGMQYLLAGSCFFPCRLSLLRAIGSKFWTRSFDGGGTVKEDESSISWRGAAEALRRRVGRTTWRAGRTSLQRPDAARNGSSRNAMSGVDGLYALAMG